MASQGSASVVYNGKTDDPFANFQFQPPKPVGKYRPYARRTRFRAMQAMRLSQPRNSITGSAQDLLDPAKLMNLQEDAKSRRISSEVFKQRLYESVVMPKGGRRAGGAALPGATMHASYSGHGLHTEDVHSDEVTKYYMHPTRLAMSVPVTPATSSRTTPCGSPTQNRAFMFGMFPRHVEEDLLDDVEISDSTRGLASLFSPVPKFVPAARWTPRVEQEQKEQQGAETSAGEWPAENAEPPLILQAAPRSRRARGSQGQRSPSPMDDENTL